MPVKINGATSGSVTLAAPASGSDFTLTLPGVTDTLMRQGGGKILQIVRATDSTLRSTTSTSFVDVTGMSVTITPQKSDSAILILCSSFFRISTSSSGNQRGDLQITDSSNNAISGAQAFAFGPANYSFTATASFDTPFFLIAYATPATTSAVTYKLRFRSLFATTTTSVINSEPVGQIFAIEVSA